MNMPKIITHEQYVQRLIQRNIKAIPLEDYQGARTPIMHKCLVHNYNWKTTPDNLSRGHMCPLCGKNKHLSHEEYLSLLMPIKHPNVIVIGKYVDMKTKISCRCKDCGYEWEASPEVLLRGNGCRLCGRKRFGESCRKTHDDFIKEITEINPSVRILGRYTTAKSRIDCECLVCGHKWSPFADDLHAGKGCPICCLSHGEKEIARVLTLYCVSYIPQYSFNDLIGIGNGLLSYDFYIPSYNLLLEYQGEQHERPTFGQDQFIVGQEHDRRKREYAKQHGFRFLEIWYYDYDNIEEILKNNLNLLSVETTGVAQ